MSAQPIQPQPTPHPELPSAEALALVKRLKELAHELHEKDQILFSRFVGYLAQMEVDESEEAYAAWKQSLTAYSLADDE